MSLMSNRLFRMAAAPALALASLSSAAVPFAAANAQERPVAMQPANTNVAVDPVVFQTLDGRRNSMLGVQAAASEASRDKIAIIVWGGNRDLQRQALAAAYDLRDQGIPLAFIVGPQQIQTDNAVMIEIYAAGAPAYDRPATIGIDNLALVRPDTVQSGQRAYQTAFPREAAALRLTPQ